MQIKIDVIPHTDQRYDTCGDWIFNQNGDLVICVSETGNADYNFLIGLHELVEAYLCKKRGIKEEDVSAYDKQFEAMRAAYPLVLGTQEPGDQPTAPYQAEHRTASAVEGILCREIGIDLQAYDEAVNALKYEPTKN